MLFKLNRENIPCGKTEEEENKSKFVFIDQPQNGIETFLFKVY